MMHLAFWNMGEDGFWFCLFAWRAVITSSIEMLGLVVAQCEHIFWRNYLFRSTHIKYFWWFLCLRGNWLYSIQIAGCRRSCCIVASRHLLLFALLLIQYLGVWASRHTFGLGLRRLICLVSILPWYLFCKHFQPCSVVSQLLQLNLVPEMLMDSSAR